MAKLLLLEDVENLGRSGDVVNVKPGFARNFLLPQGIALTADKRALNMQAKLQEERRKRAAEDKREAEQQASQLEGKELVSIVKVDPEGHLYGSVSAGDIHDLLVATYQIDLDKRCVQLKQPIRTLGNHTIPLKLKEGVKVTILLRILSEEQAANPEAAAPAAEESEAPQE